MKTRVGYAAGGAEGEVSNRLEFFLNLAGFMAKVFTRGPCYTKPHMFARLWVTRGVKKAYKKSSGGHVISAMASNECIYLESC